jgi:hypothetical protein
MTTTKVARRAIAGGEISRNDASRPGQQLSVALVAAPFGAAPASAQPGRFRRGAFCPCVEGALNTCLGRLSGSSFAASPWMVSAFDQWVGPLSARELRRNGSSAASSGSHLYRNLR